MPNNVDGSTPNNSESDTDHALHPACNAMKTNKSREKCHQFVATPMLPSF